MSVFLPTGGNSAVFDRSQAPRAPLLSAIMLCPLSPSCGYVVGLASCAHLIVSGPSSASQRDAAPPRRVYPSPAEAHVRQSPSAKSTIAGSRDPAGFSNIRSRWALCRHFEGAPVYSATYRSQGCDNSSRPSWLHRHKPFGVFIPALRTIDDTHDQKHDRNLDEYTHHCG